MDLFILLTVMVYALVLLVMGGLWLLMKGKRSEGYSGKVSVIVPFRNEREHLPTLLASLKDQEYDNFEVVFVDDHSTDDSKALLENELEKAPFSNQVFSLTDQEGKKAAIDLGVSQAGGEIILTTDADCQFSKTWVKEMINAFSDKSVQMVTGPVALTGKRLFQRWQQMEFASLIALGAVSIQRNSPLMANGANLAYRKSAYQQVNGFQGIDQIPSGDDELLMMKIHQAFPGGVVFQKSQGAVASTPALRKWSELRQQRLRWASKWSFGKRTSTMAMAVFILVLHLSLILLPAMIMLDWLSSDTAVLAYRIRFIAEAIWVMMVATFFSRAISIRAFLLHQLLYPFYAVYFGLMANFGNYRWKGRSYPVRHNKYDRRRV